MGYKNWIGKKLIVWKSILTVVCMIISFIFICWYIMKNKKQTLWTFLLILYNYFFYLKFNNVIEFFLSFKWKS